MAAFSRGSMMASSCCNLPFQMATRSSFMLPRCVLMQPFASLRSFSLSTASRAKSQSKLLSKKAIDNKLKQLRQEVEDRKLAQIQADKIRRQRQEELNAQYGEPITVAEGQSESNGVKPSPTAILSKMALNEYNPTSIKKHSYTPAEESIGNKDMNRIATELMAHGKEIPFYRAPNRRWHLGLASVSMLSLGLFMTVGMVWSYLPALESGSLYVSAVASFMVLFGGYLLWMSVSKRAHQVRSMTLIPKQYGKTRIFELRVEGTSLIPFKRRVVQQPLWEVKVNRPLKSVQLPEKSPETDLRTVMNLQRPFYWFAHTVSGLWNETRHVILPPQGLLMRLYTEEGNTGPLSAWWLDSRGKFWRDQEGFDYFVKTVPGEGSIWRK